MSESLQLGVEQLESVSLLSGFTPAELRAAYGFDAAAREYGRAALGAGVTVAIVDAYNDPTIAHDVTAFDHRYGLRPADLSVANLGAPGDTGGATGWSVEEALDVEAAHALVPLARIVLVEAPDASLAALATAEMDAESIPGVGAVSNSWGAVDDPFDGPDDVPYELAFAGRPGVVIAAAAGDASGPLSFPAALPGVIAVGGTVLTHDRTGYHQRPWLTYAPGYTDPAKLAPDVRMVGGPPGYEVFGTSGFGHSTWANVWGTSLSCPAFVAIVGAADGVRIGRGEAPLGTSQLTAGLHGDATTASAFIAQFA